MRVQHKSCTCLWFMIVQRWSPWSSTQWGRDGVVLHPHHLPHPRLASALPHWYKWKVSPCWTPIITLLRLSYTLISRMIVCHVQLHTHKFISMIFQEGDGETLTYIVYTHHNFSTSPHDGWKYSFVTNRLGMVGMPGCDAAPQIQHIIIVLVVILIIYAYNVTK